MLRECQRPIRGASGLYFLVVGAGIALSGAPIAAGRLIGPWLHLGVLAPMIVWSVVQFGPDVRALLPRLALPAIFAAYMLSSRVQPLIR